MSEESFNFEGGIPLPDNEWWQSPAGMEYFVRSQFSPEIVEVISREGLQGEAALQRAFELKETSPEGQATLKNVDRILKDNKDFLDLLGDD